METRNFEIAIAIICIILEQTNSKYVNKMFQFHFSFGVFLNKNVTKFVFNFFPFFLLTELKIIILIVFFE